MTESQVSQISCRFSPDHCASLKHFEAAGKCLKAESLQGASVELWGAEIYSKINLYHILQRLNQFAV